MTTPDRLRRAVAHAAPRLRALPDPDAAAAPGTWSPKQVVGHLVDSAAVNHGRIVRAATGGGLDVEGYDQDAWVAAGRYADADWPALVALWRLLNLQIARVADAIPEAVLDALHGEHSLDRIAWRPVPADQPATLRYLIDDYLGHLSHHLRAIDPALDATLGVGQRQR